MLTAIRIGNFKAFAETQRIPIRPLTLIYCANSSGKSSAIHGLLLARHAQETGNLDVHRTNVGGESVDLGGVRQFIHRRDVKRRMEWSTELNTASIAARLTSPSAKFTQSFTKRLADLLAPIKTLMVSLTIGIALDDQERPLQEALPEIHTYEILGDNRSLVRMSKRRDGKLQLDRLDHEHPVFREVLRAIIETATTTENLNPSDDYVDINEIIFEIVPEIVASIEKFLPEGLARSSTFSLGTQVPLFPVSRGNRKEDLAATARFFIPRALDDLLCGIGGIIQEELSRLQYLGPLRSYPPRYLAFSQHHDPNWHAGGGYAWDVIRRNAEVRKKVNAWLSAPNRLQTPYELLLRPLFAWEQISSFWESFTSQLSKDQISQLIKQGLQEMRSLLDKTLAEAESDPEKLQQIVNEISESIFDPEKASRQFGESLPHEVSDPINDLVMIDRRSNTVVSHRDVGIGVSQVLPVLVCAYASQNQLIAIEQPEIYLHPALQADLGDVFIQSALGQTRNRFLIETHSEHLLLRIMRRMRETCNGNLPQGIPTVVPEDVCVLFVEADGSKSIIREMPINKRGELVKAWPGGFFEEGLREVF